MGLVDLPSAANHRVCQNLIGGRWQQSQGPLSPVTSPYTGTAIGMVPESTPAEVAAVCREAQKAFSSWQALTLKERSAPLFIWRELMLKELASLSHLVAAESGKTVAEGRAGLLKGLEVAEFALSLQNLASGGSLEVSRGVTCQEQRRALGVVVGITPFNFPAMVPLWMIPIALTLGNCFILKPSEKVPLTAQRMGQLLIDAGYPSGVFSLINGGRMVAEALLRQPEVEAAGFVGSTPAARAVYAAAAAHGKRVLALGGAKNQLILAPDAEPELAVRGVVDSFTGCAGQRCMAASLLITVGEVEPLLERITKAAGELQLGAGMGALIDHEAKARIEGVIARAVQAGAKLRLDGRGVAAPPGYAGGSWLAPTILDHATSAMECVQSEIFGPVLTIVRTPHLTAALELAQSLPYGNALSVFTASGAVARHVQAAATSGMIGINIGVPVPREPFSFGGTKASKFGHGDITGVSSLDFWSHLIKITTKWSSEAEQNWMS